MDRQSRVYTLGENVTITLTNIGNDCVEIGVILCVIIYAYLQSLLGDLDDDADGNDYALFLQDTDKGGLYRFSSQNLAYQKGS